MKQPDVSRLMQTAMDYFDYTMEVQDLGDCLEVTGRRGGDVCTYRFYLDGRITER